MSIASEFAEAPLKRQQPRFGTRGGQPGLAGAWVTTDGYLFVANERFTPAEALKLAEWIQRTFSNTEGDSGE